jgi:hypothetical protein
LRKTIDPWNHNIAKAAGESLKRKPVILKRIISDLMRQQQRRWPEESSQKGNKNEAKTGTEASERVRERDGSVPRFAVFAKKTISLSGILIVMNRY